MSFIYEQKIKGKVYLYKSTSYWDKEKKQPRQKRVYLGKKDEVLADTIIDRLKHTAIKIFVVVPLIVHRFVTHFEKALYLQKLDVSNLLSNSITSTL